MLLVVSSIRIFEFPIQSDVFLCIKKNSEYLQSCVFLEWTSGTTNYNVSHFIINIQLSHNLSAWDLMSSITFLMV